MLSIGVVGTACTAEDAGGVDVTSTSPAGGDADQVDVEREQPLGNGGGGGRGRQFLRLAPFADCSAYLDHVKWQAHERVGPYGLDPTGYPWPLMAASRLVEDASFDMAAAATEAPAATMAPAATQATGALTDLSPASAEATSEAAGGDDSGSATDSSVSGTNTQEEGVDEPDIIKADGNRIITISENVLTYVDISSGTPVVAGQLTIPDGWGHQLFLNGDRAVLLTNSGAWARPDAGRRRPSDHRRCRRRRRGRLRTGQRCRPDVDADDEPAVGDDHRGRPLAAVGIADRDDTADRGPVPERACDRRPPAARRIERPAVDAMALPAEHRR